MKKILIISLLICSAFISKASTCNDDSTQAILKAKLEQVEKQVKQLQSEISSLRSTDSTLALQLANIKQTTPATQPKKLVVNRRGSKQASFQ